MKKKLYLLLIIFFFRILHWTIMQGLVESACTMIKTTPEYDLLNILNSDGQSPLHLAVLAKQPRIIRELVLAGANLEVTNFRGNTPLHLSCSIGDFQSAYALISPLNPMEYYYLRPGRKVPTLPQNFELRNYEGNRSTFCFIILQSFFVKHTFK